MRTIISLTLALSLSACTTDGSVDWGKVGEGTLLVAGAALLVGAAVVTAGAYVPPPIVTTCNSWGRSTTCITQ